ncbi:aromatic ring-hydroxylating oxygenase subunit alpha [Amycolatopsis anabasis]|uniref:aromatic ring-hydroxylating oxygenase subunit alpha n=1 Tax=Amycolatopsis anabasis TaxID=1840409 RepID=UPI00131B1CB1|nr:aromatic ring-hydroxylating dioxygenase subunit alpha [Amycolatopsis anabasis]
MYADLIDFDKVGTVSADIFHSEEMYRRELSTVFARSWLFLAHESQLRTPGDFVTAMMGEDPIIVSRQRDGGIRAVLNVCRHRGMRVCRQDFGNTKRFTCSFHGWSYDNAGTLIHVPREAEGYHDRLDKSGWSLTPVTRVETYRGMIFGTWDAEAPDLIDYLDTARPALDSFLDTLGGDIELVGPMKWRIAGNWKLPAEGLGTDGYHAETTHASALQAIGGMAEPRRIFQYASAAGHAAAMIDVGVTQQVHSEIGVGPTPQGEQDNSTVAHATVFPNLSFIGYSGPLRVWQPRGPEEMEVWGWVAIPAGLDPETRRQKLTGVTLSFSSSGIFESDDSENWSEISAVGRGFAARSTPLNYQMGMGFDDPTGADIPGFDVRTGHLFNDIGARSFYTRWAQLMDGPELALAPPTPPPNLGMSAE